MDSPEMKPKVLVEINGRFKKQMNWLRIWVDPREPCLTFKIAALNSDFLGDASLSDGRTGIYIFHARLLGHGKDATLTAEPFRRFEGIFPGDTGKGALNDRYFILLKTSKSEGGEWEFDLHIFDYERDCVVTVKLRGLRVTLLYSLFFLPGGKIAIVHPDSIYIYAMPTFPEVSDSEWHPIRTLPFDRALGFAQTSEPYIGETSTSIIFNRKGILALVIPHDPTESHTFVLITERSLHSVVLRTTGLFYAVDYSETAGCLTLFMYLWDPLSEDGVRGARVRRHEVDVSDTSFQRSSGCVSFDGVIGRLVMHTLLGRELVVYDMIRGKDL